MDEPDSTEDAWAGVLNGAMIALLGAAFPAVFIWQVVAQWPDGLSARQDTTTQDLSGGVLISVLSLQFIWTGARLLRRNLRWLRKPG